MSLTEHCNSFSRPSKPGFIDCSDVTGSAMFTNNERHATILKKDDGCKFVSFVKTFYVQGMASRISSCTRGYVKGERHQGLEPRSFERARNDFVRAVRHTAQRQVDMTIWLAHNTMFY